MGVWWPIAQLHFLHINPHTTHNFSNRSDEGLTLETSAFLPFKVANLRFQLVVNTKLTVSQLMSTRHTWSRLARHLEKIPRDEPQHRQARENKFNKLSVSRTKASSPSSLFCSPPTNSSLFPQTYFLATDVKPNKFKKLFPIKWRTAKRRNKQSNTIFVKASHVALGRTSPKLSFSSQTLRNEIITWKIFCESTFGETDRLSVRLIDFTNDDSSRPVRIVSFRQHWI